MKFTLDFTLNSAQDRLNFVKSLNLSSLTKKELELCSDYILYGKDPDGKSCVEKKEIFIKTKYSSYQKKEPVSLEALMESPTFDETIFNQNYRIYKSSKPEKIDREKFQDIPGMKELWKEIDKIDRILKVNQGKEAPADNEDIPTLTSKELYHLNHQLIELRKQQYILKDSVYPEQIAAKNYGIFFSNPTDSQLNYPVFPCGTLKKEKDPDFYHPYAADHQFQASNIEDQIEELRRNNKPYFNFLDKEHIYQLCLAYYEILDFASRFPDSPLNGLLWTLDFYIEKANLSEQQKFIVECKKKRMLNKDICLALKKELGISHKENYVSTIWNRVCGLIADAADLNYDEWCCQNFEKAWKTCSCCGQRLLRDPRNFVRKTKAIDGLTNRCKKCDQKKRRGEI